ncbi:GTP-binding protein [Nocardiopsis composta]
MALTLNIGIVAHVDAGKTSLTERLLYDTGAIDRLGRVDAGDTRTDTGRIERERGITVRAAVAPFTVGDTRVNLIDTPGHTDFVAEVERALTVLDGAILVLSAVEGVQAHTRVLMRTLREAGLPTLLFVNKTDRAGARPDGVLADVRRRLAPNALPSGRSKTPARPMRARCRSPWTIRGSRRAPRRPSPSRTTPCWRRSWTACRCRRRPSWPSGWPRRPPAAWCTRCCSARRSPAPASTRCSPPSPACSPRRGRGRRTASRAAPCSRSNAPPPGRRPATCGCSPAGWSPGPGSPSTGPTPGPHRTRGGSPDWRWWAPRATGAGR